MNRVPVLVTFIISLTMLAAMTGLVGCSHGDGGTSPVITPELTAEASLPESPAGEGVTLGYFQFVWDDDGMVTVETTEPPRGADINVTNYASLIIEDFFFNEEHRNWYITATLRNMSPYTGYDVWAVFHSLGNKFVLNQDGYLWALPPIFPEPTRCAFIAYGKGNPDRVFPPMTQDTRTIVIHQPEGIPKLAPIGFWIDATLHPRSTPGVEDLEVELIDDTNYHLTGFVWDHQSPSEDLTVWADCTNFNGVSYVQLYDDGEHGDGMPGDKTWGCDFSGDPEDGPYTITVYAFDPGGNQGENDARFWHGDDEPCDLPIEHWPYETIIKGEHCGIDYEKFAVINDWPTWETIWQEHTSDMLPPPPPPPINFDMHTVIGVWIGERPSNNHAATIHDVAFDPCEDLVTVQYTYTPYQACGPLDVMTAPFHLVVTPKYEFDTYFAGEEVDCPGPPPECIEEIEWDTLQHGNHSSIKEPYELRIPGPDHFDALWEAHTANQYPPPPKPDVIWDLFDVIAVGIGERPTSGFECNIWRVCLLEDQSIGVFYEERIPGPDCEVEQVFTQPFHWALIPKIDLPVHFFKNEEVYNCGPSDCQEPVMFWPLDQGPHTGHPMGNFVFRTPEELNQFWSVHKPDQPVPPVDWEHMMVAGMLIGERPSTGFHVDTYEVCLNGFDDPGNVHMDIRATEFIPGDNCEVLWVITNPFQLIIIPRFEGPVFFEIGEEVYDCPSGDCMPVDFWPLADGIESCEPPEHFPMFNNDILVDVWHGIQCYHPDMPPPPEVNWDMEVPFVIQTGGMPTSGYFVTIDEACINFEEQYVEINWTLNIPGPGCPVMQVETHPWIIGAIPWHPGIQEFEWNFIGNESVYDCPPCEPVPWYELADGGWSCAEPGEYGFPGFNDAFEELWHKLHCDEPAQLPEIPDPINPAWEMKPFVIQMHMVPTSGFYIEINSVCLEECNAWVDYTIMIPADDCETFPDEFKPWVFGVAEFPPIDCEINWNFAAHEEVYHCNDCNPTPFHPIAEGDESCAEPGQYGYQYLDDYEFFWKKVNCVEPGDPAPPLPAEPPPSGDNVMYHIGIQLPERPSTGYYITVDEVCFEGCDVYIEWTENIPGDNCDVEPVETRPWYIAAVELPPVYCYWTWHFTKSEEVYSCPDDPCYDFETVAGNNVTGPEASGGWYFDSQVEFYQYWAMYHPGEPMPEIDWYGGWGAYAIHLGERPTTGFEVEVFEVCFSDDPFGVAVRWVEWIPGPTCNVEQIETFPWTVVTFPLVDLPYFDEGFEEVYQCD